jgi:protein-S-isoprenylcysteine O-methyltransferase Ste14
MPLFAIHPLWRLIFWISYLAWALFEIWVFSRDRRAVRGQNADGGSLPAIVLLLLIGIFTAFGAPYVLRLGRMHLPQSPIFGVAILLVWSGMVLRLWAILTLGNFFRTSVVVQDEHRLVVAGPYRLLRHPPIPAPS